jgi:hypothetical protein
VSNGLSDNRKRGRGGAETFLSTISGHNTVSKLYQNKQISKKNNLMNSTSQVATQITNSSSSSSLISNANNELSSVGYSAANISYFSLNVIIPSPL